MCSIDGRPLKRRRPQPLPLTDTLPIYLDYNATTPLCEEAWQSMISVSKVWGNPSSTHPYGLAAKYALEQAREKVCKAIKAENPETIIFTSGGTESNNLAIIGGVNEIYAKDSLRCNIVCSSVEHPAVEEVFSSLSNKENNNDGFKTHRFPVDIKTGCVNVEEWRKYFLSLPNGPKSVALVSVMHANNEIGSINPIKELVKLVKELCGEETIFHTDAAQSIGKIEVNISEMKVDLLSICSHKFYGPKGIGALYVKKGIKIRNILFGAGHELGIRPGTENVLLATGMAEALYIACKNLSKNMKILRETRAELIRVLEEELKKVGMWYVINGDITCTLPNTLNIALYKETPIITNNTTTTTTNNNNKTQRTYISSQGLIHAVGDKVCISAGSACHAASEEIKISNPLKSIKIEPRRAVGTLRISTGRGTTLGEVRRAARIIVRQASQQFAETV